MSITPSALVLVTLGAAGFVLALYFTLVTYGKVRADSRWIPAVCRMDDQACAKVVHTPEARVLGLPNSVYGMAWYAVVVAVGLRPQVALMLPGRWFLLALVAAGTVALSGYLAWVLLRKLRVLCPLCFLGHGLNVAIAALLVHAAWLTP